METIRVLCRNQFLRYHSKKRFSENPFELEYRIPDGEVTSDFAKEAFHGQLPNDSAEFTSDKPVPCAHGVVSIVKENHIGLQYALSNLFRAIGISKVSLEVRAVLAEFFFQSIKQLS